MNAPAIYAVVWYYPMRGNLTSIWDVLCSTIMNSSIGQNKDFYRTIGAKLNPVFVFTSESKDSSVEKNSSSSSIGRVSTTTWYSLNYSRKAPRYVAAAATSEI